MYTYSHETGTPIPSFVMSRRFLLVLAVHLIAASAEKIPKQLQLEKCNFSDKDFQECLRHAIEDAIPKLRNGAPSVGIPKLDPVEILELAIQQGNEKGALTMNFKFKNMLLDGVSKGITLRNFKLDKKTLILSARALNEGPITVKGRYQAKGRLLAVPIDSDGDCRFELYNISTDVALHFKDAARKGIKYWDLTKLDYDIVDIEKSNLKLDNLIRGNKGLDESLNQSINQNSKELEPSLRPAFSKALRLYFTDIIQRFFKKVPIDEIINGVK